MQPWTPVRVSLIVCVLAFAAGVGTAFRGTGGLWPGYDVLAIRSDIPQKNVTGILAESGFRNVLSEVTQPYVFWDFSGMASVPLIEVGNRFLPGDPRVSPYAEKLRGMYRGYGPDGMKSLYYMRSADVSGKSMRIAKGKLDALDPGWRILKGGSARIIPLFILGTAAVLAAFLVFKRDGRQRNAGLALMPIAFAFIDPAIAIQAALAGFFCQIMDDSVGDTVLWILDSRRNKSTLPFASGVFTKNWKLACLAFLPFLPSVNDVLLLFSGAAALCFQCSVAFLSRMTAMHKDPSRVMPRFSPILLAPGVRGVSISGIPGLVSIVAISLLYCFSTVSIPGSRPPQKGGDLSIPLPHGYNVPDWPELPSTGSFLDHVTGQARIQYSRTDGKFPQEPYSDYSETPNGLSVQAVLNDRKIRISKDMPTGGIEAVIQASCGSGTPVRAAYSGYSVATTPLSFLFAAVIVCVVSIPWMAIGRRRKASGEAICREDGYDLESKLPESA